MTERELSRLIGLLRFHAGRFKSEVESGESLRSKGTTRLTISTEGAQEHLTALLGLAENLETLIPEREVVVAEREPDEEAV